MSKDKLTDYSATNASNTDIGGINIDEGMLPSDVNNALREVMTHLKDFAEGTQPVNSINFAGNATFGDNDKAIFGAGNDLQIYHDAGNSRIVDAGTGNLNLQADNNINILNNAGTEFKAQFITNGAVNLFYDNSKKLATTSTGIDVTGTITADNLTMSDSSTPQITLTDTTNSVTGVVFADNGEMELGTTSNHAVAVKTNNTERLRITNGGNVGIGTSSPDVTSHIVGSSGKTTLASYDAQTIAVVENNADAQFAIVANSANSSQLFFGDESSELVGRIRYDHSADAMRFYTNSSERLRIDSSGNVGIGTTSPGSSTKLNVAGRGLFTNGVPDPADGSSAGVAVGYDTTNNYGFVQSIQTGVATKPLYIQPTGTDKVVIANGGGNVGIGTTSPQYKLHLHEATSGSNYLLVTNSTTGSNNNDGLVIGLAADESALIYHQESSAIRFGTASTERMRIVNSVLRVGQSTSDAPGSGNTTTGCALDGGLGIIYGSRSSGASAVFNVNANAELVRCHRSGNLVGGISVTTSATSFNTSSDHRLKENVADMTGAIDRVKALAPKRFNFIADADTTVDGFLAHEAQAVVPESVTGEHNEVDADGNAVMQGIDQSKLVPLLTGALQEAIAKIETLETQRADLEARVAALEAN